jgi:acyl phosphate:glycerol-3-phosphate acyltransferase
MENVTICMQILILGYVLGSVPFGVILAKAFKLPDPRYIGSGNIGATNMLRTGNKKVALLTLLLDAAKGAVAVILVSQLFPVFDVARAAVDACGMQPTLENCGASNPHYTALAVLAAAVGHMYSPWLKFKGGKGVATLFGGALAFSWPVGMAGFIIWAIVMFVKRYVSLASIIALAAAPLITWLRVDGTSAFILAIACGIAIWKHRDNIKRLRQGFEPKMGMGNKAP